MYVIIYNILLTNIKWVISISVYVPKRDRCRAPERIVAHKKSAYLSSKTSLQTFCGVHESPWILEAKPGQQIELTLIDLSWTNNSESRSRCPLNYGYILNMDSDDVIKICGGIKAEQILYSSVGHRIQIVLEMTSVQNYNFLIKFQGKKFYYWSLNFTTSYGCVN